MRAQLKTLDSPDVPELKSYAPENPRCFGFLLEASFGLEGVPGADLFDIMVCTGPWLEDQARQTSGIIIGRHYLIVDRYDFGRIKRFLEDYANKCEGGTWDEIAEKLGRLGHWEFEDIDEPAMPRR